MSPVGRVPVNKGTSKGIDDHERFWKFVDRSSSSEGCWLWTGAKETVRGYGLFTTPTKMVKAHRVAFHLANGPIPEGLSVLHHCDTPLCCRPSHLFLGTQADNLRDAFAKGRMVSPPVLRGEQNPTAVLTEKDVRQIRRDHAAGISLRALAKRYNVSRRNVQFIVRRLSWAHLAE